MEKPTYEELENRVADLEARLKGDPAWADLKNRIDFLALQNDRGPVGVLLIGREKNIISCNRRFIEMWDLPGDYCRALGEDCPLEPLIALLAEPDAFRRRLEELCDTKDEIFHEAIELADRRMFDVHSAPFMLTPTEVAGRIWYFRDISEERQTARDLAATLEKIRNEKIRTESILAAIGDGISIQDCEFKVIYQNRVHQELIGDHVGEYCYQAYEGADDICDGCPVKKSFQDGEVHIARRSTERSVRPSLHVEIKSSPLFNELGEIVAGIEVVRDVSNRVLMEEELIKIRKLESIGVLAGGIAHDFNNLLTAVYGNIELARMELDPRSEAYQLLTEAGRANDRTRYLTMQLLTFSRGGEPVKENTSIPNLVDEASMLALSGSSVRSVFEQGINLWPVEADRGQIGQAFQNILVNAREAIVGGGTVRITAENCMLAAYNSFSLEPGRYVRISFTDDGRGIPEEIRLRVFDPYFSTKPKGHEEGRGLGLAIAHSIIIKHGGRIAVESRLGGPTTFSVYLPAGRETERESRGSDMKKEKRISEGNKRILLLEDESMVADVEGRMLRHLNYDVELAVRGEEAVSIYKEAREKGVPFDLVILDLTIRGGMGGQETLRQLLEFDPHVRAIVASGYGDDKIMSDFRDYGFQAAVTKPFTIAALEKALRQLEG